MESIKIAVGADGKGTTLKEIVAACEAGDLAAEVVLVFSSKEECTALDFAKEKGIAICTPSSGNLLSVLKNYRANLICLAGYLKLIPFEIVATFPHAILNSHPAIDLVRFGGKGMYGTYVTEAVIKAGEKITGSTIHFVNEKYDEGAIIMQSRVPVLPDDTPDSLMERQLPIERKMYIEVIRQWIESGGNPTLNQRY